MTFERRRSANGSTAQASTKARTPPGHFAVCFLCPLGALLKSADAGCHCRHFKGELSSCSSSALVYRAATGASQVLFGKTATQDPDCSKSRLARNLGVVWRIPHHGDLRFVGAGEKHDSSLKDIGMWFGFLGIIRGGFPHEVDGGLAPQRKCRLVH
jgi:hypothetical protein